MTDDPNATLRELIKHRRKYTRGFNGFNDKTKFIEITNDPMVLGDYQPPEGSVIFTFRKYMTTKGDYRLYYSKPHNTLFWKRCLTTAELESRDTIPDIDLTAILGNAIKKPGLQ